MRNAEIAAHFDELADLYELDGAVVYRVAAYRSAAKAIREAGVSVAELARQGRAEEIRGVGKTIAEKIGALLDGGAIPAAEKLRAKYPPGLVAITRLPGIGPKRARRLFDELGICTVDELRSACEQQRLRGVRGFGAKFEENVLAALAAGADGSPRTRLLLSRALAIADSVVAALRDHPAAERVELAGSARRWVETCKDLDVVAASGDPRALADAFLALPQLAEGSAAPSRAQASGTAGARGVTHQGLAIELRIVAPGSFGSLLQHLTGSKRHNELLRADAVRRGLHVSEYGIADEASGDARGCATEEEVYARLGLAWIPPELREGRGELEAARAGELPRLVEIGDLRGELHCHTVASDGRNTIEQMAAAAAARGYEYLAVTDHSATHGFGNDVSPDDLRAQIERVRAANEAGAPVRVLAGSEVNILPDGSLDYGDALLAALDWVVASVHTSFRLGEREMTKRIVTAMEHPLVDAIGHPTGRLIDRREPYAVDVEALVEAALRTGTFLEVNGNPDRRDLSELNARMAVEAGATLTIDSDAHGVETLANVRYGVATARRAWVVPERVANTRPWAELDELRKTPRRR